MKNKTKIGRDVKKYVKTAKSSKGKSDFNQRHDDISFELSKLKMYDSFYDRRLK